VDTTLIKIRETILKETLSTDTREAAKVVSEDEDTEVSEEASTCRNGLFSKGSLYKRVAYPLLNAKMKKTKNLCLYDCYLFRQQEQRKVVLFIPRGQSGKFEKEINQIFKDELSLFCTSKTMEKVFENINVRANHQQQTELKNHVVKTKI